MKLFLVILGLLLALPALAETYVTEEFIVEGEGVAPASTVTATSPSYVITTEGPGIIAPAPVTTVVSANDTPVYVGMSQGLCLETMGPPTVRENFRKFRSRKQGIYDEIWTYETPGGVIYVYIKERKVLKVDYR